MLSERSTRPRPQDPHPSLHDFWRRWLAERGYFQRMCTIWLRGNRHEAEEVVCCGALRAVEYLHNHPDGVEKFRPWALQLLRNLCLDNLRVASRWVSADAAEPVVVIPCRDALPDRDVYRKELRAALTGAVARLPPRLSEVLTRRLCDGLEYDEIGRELGITQENARKRLQLARARLRERLDQVG